MIEFNGNNSGRKNAVDMFDGSNDAMGEVKK